MKIKSIIIYILLSLALLSLIYFIVRQTGNSEEINYIESFSGKDLADLQDNEELKDSLQLALVDIDIVQGSEGEKTWQMKAEWGTYIQESSDLLAQKPFITFWNSSSKDENKQNSKEENTPIYISAIIGRVQENNTFITLEEDVKILQDTLVIEGSYLEFFTKENYTTLPRGSIITSPTMLGKSQELTWELDNNLINAQGEVVLIINNDNKTYTLDYEIKEAPIFKDETQTEG